MAACHSLGGRGFLLALRFKLRGNETETALAFAFTPVVGLSCKMSVAKEGFHSEVWRLLNRTVDFIYGVFL